MQNQENKVRGNVEYNKMN